MSDVERDLTAVEAAVVLGVSRTTIQDLIARGKLHPLPKTPDGRHYFRKSAVEALRVDRELRPSRRGGRR